MFFFFFLTKESISQSYCEMKNKWVVLFSKLLGRKAVQLLRLFLPWQTPWEASAQNKKNRKVGLLTVMEANILLVVWLSSLELRKAIF